MSFEDAATVVACALVLACSLMLVPRARRGEPLERPQVQRLEFDPLLMDPDGPVLDLEAA
ncbi:hypothetical protein [Methylobacterium aerolatum]|uniref:Uncharacterized protein n=1 Tax=Methylobacterium aerolatum TaxID=418708 RepID=A0ABU0HW58_9HYPH|nr:hypothetical protein [Methylobacterium aerolatum]MDQ0446570.1 hypothetical protein [Methylobacterium aerolatum]GJD33269.1 hypothetical protein FMGBMHLM_0155 [Methylobacterium aerolatum]